MLQNTRHLNVSSAEMEKPSSDQCFSTLTLPEGGLWEQPLGQARPRTALQDPSRLAAFSPSHQAVFIA